MSTRCQLRFTETDSDRVAQIYRHSDGYPRSVLPLLEILENQQELLRETGTQRDASYAAAQFILVDKLQYITHTTESKNETYSNWPDTIDSVLDPEAWNQVDATPTYLLGHGVEDPSCGIHGDEEYLYVIELPARNPFENPANWKIKISEHCGFPRWDGPTEDAFDVADWQFEGTLSEAIAEVEEGR